MTIPEDGEPALSRTQRRLLRRIYNGRRNPIIVDGAPFLTYKEASRYLEGLAPQARDAAYAQMKDQAALIEAPVGAPQIPGHDQ